MNEDRSARYARPCSVVVSAMCVMAAVSSSMAVGGPPPTGDYGDAPDAGGLFPTTFATANSRVGAPGVHHLTTGMEMLGAAVSAEAGALDPADPDGVPNLVNGDSDDGVVGVFVTAAGGPFGAATSFLQIQVVVTVAAGAPDVTRYLNVLFDVNGDGQWRNSAAGAEWMVVNLAVTTAPGTSETLTIPMGFVPTSSIVFGVNSWLRVTLSRTAVDLGTFSGVGGWDGSGAFQFGETEDYPFDSLGLPPSSNCNFYVKCDPKVVVIDHNAGGAVTLRGFVSGGPTCTLTCDTISIHDIGPIGGAGVINGPGGIDPLQGEGSVNNGAGAQCGGPITPANSGAPIAIVPITPFPHPPPASFLQSFSLQFQLSGWTAPGGTKVYAASITCGVIILHNAEYRKGILLFGGGNTHLPGSAIPIPADDGGDPLGFVVFGNDQPTSGAIVAAQAPVLPPGISNPFGGLLATTTLLELDFDGSPEFPVETEIVALSLTGYTDQMVADANVPSEHSLLPFKMPVYPNLMSDPQDEMTMDVGGLISVDDINNVVTIDNPTGFSIWGLHGDTCPWDCGVDNDGIVGIVDFLALLAQWGGAGDCDFDGGGVGITDFLILLASWGPCP
jgi:hypothetical protein